MEVQVNLGGFDAVEEALLEAAVRKALDADGREAELSVTLVDDAEIKRLNREYRGRDRPTDVIAFSLGSPEEPLGDVYVGADQARRQAEALGVPLSEELVRLAIHGTLHVLGHDHPDGDDRFASPMYVLQEQLLGEVLGKA
ncbi:MAG: rRNA maturation RNase YbeY [Gemmatimonadetes bacterium]|nr:rRNA maturation RNase YbeY [Gemmatimonadota bacterium]